jgi:hypothetical protein
MSSFGEKVVFTIRDSTLSGTMKLFKEPLLHFVLIGATYDTSPVKTEDMSVTLPMGETYRIGTGTQYKLNQQLSLGFAYELIWMGTLNVNQTRRPLAGNGRRRIQGCRDSRLPSGPAVPVLRSISDGFATHIRPKSNRPPPVSVLLMVRALIVGLRGSKEVKGKIFLAKKHMIFPKDRMPGSAIITLNEIQKSLEGNS